MATAQLLLCLVLAQAAPQTVVTDGTALIAGRVVDGTTGKPVSAAVVAITSATFAGPGRPPVDRVLTDGDGRYFFDRLTKGLHTVTVTKPGWIDGGFGRVRPGGGTKPLEILKDDEMRIDVNLKLWKYAAMSGNVVDEAGEPVVDAQVRAVRRRFIAGRQRLEFAGVARTDDRGEFRLSGLMPGDYTAFLPSEISSGAAMFGTGSGTPDAWYQTMIGSGLAPMMFTRENAVLAGDGRSLVNSTSPMSTAPGTGAWLSVPPTFLGGTSAPTAFVRLEPGQDRLGLSLAIRRVPTQTVSGTLIVPGGNAANHVLHLLPSESADFPLFEVATAIADANGVFTFFGVPNGGYVIRVVRVPAPKEGQRFATLNSTRDMAFIGVVTAGPGLTPAVDDEPLYFADEPVGVNSQPVKNIVITLRQGVRITGRAEFDGTATRPTPETWPRTNVAVEAANGYTSRQPPAGRFAGDGSFKTASLVPGPYVIRPQAPAGWTVQSVNVGGRDVTERPVDITTDLSDIVVTFTDHSEKITGAVALGPSGAGAVADAAVLLFPADRESWASFGGASRRFRSAPVTSTGRFQMQGLLPGSYLIVAVPDEQAADWQDPASLAKLATLARSLEIKAGEAPVVNLTVRSIK